MPTQVVTVTEPQVLKAMAHPLRARLFYALYAREFARAADLARELDVPANQISFHLRLMARHGLIEEAPERARDKRDRVWRPVSTMGFEIDPAVAGTPAYREAGRRHAHEVLDAYLTRARSGFHHANDITAHLSPEEVAQMAEEIQALLMRWNARGKAHTAKDPGAPRTTYLMSVHVQPLPE
ncbi:MAG: winged helix-turn-helix domain-containing protein [Mycobacteriales bacterium]